MRRRNAGHRVSSAGAEVTSTTPGLPEPGAVGSVGGCLFVPHEDVLHFVLAEQRIINMQRRAAGITINVLDALILQEAGDHICAGKQFHSVSPLEVRCDPQDILRVECDNAAAGQPAPDQTGNMAQLGLLSSGATIDDNTQWELPYRRFTVSGRWPGRAVVKPEVLRRWGFAYPSRGDDCRWFAANQEPKDSISALSLSTFDPFKRNKGRSKRKKMPRQRRSGHLPCSLRDDVSGTSA